MYEVHSYFSKDKIELQQASLEIDNLSRKLALATESVRFNTVAINEMLKVVKMTYERYSKLVKAMVRESDTTKVALRGAIEANR